MRVGSGTGAQRWQETKQNEKQQFSQAYILRANARHTSRLTPEPSALSVAGLSPSLNVSQAFYRSSALCFHDYLIMMCMIRMSALVLVSHEK